MVRRSPTFQLAVITALAILVVAGMAWVNYRFAVANPGGNDFLDRWSGARFWVLQGVSPYDDQVGLATQQLIYGHPANPALGEDKHLFAYPLFSMIYFAPFGMLDFQTARVIWMTLLEACLVITTFLSLQISGWKLSMIGKAAILIFSILWYPAARTLILGQFSGINAVIILGAIVLVQKRRDVDAGLLLALSLSKPQMSFLVVIFSFLWGISARRPKLSAGIAGGIALLVISSMLFLPDWPLQWIRQIVAYPGNAAGAGSVISIMARALPGISKPLSLILYGIFGLYLLAEWILAWGKDDRWYLWTALMTLVITNFVGYPTATAHYVALLPILFLLFRSWQERWGRPGQNAAWIMVIVLFAGLWLVFITTVKLANEQGVMFLPIPILCLLALWWVRWWIIRRQKMFYEELSY